MRGTALRVCLQVVDREKFNNNNNNNNNNSNDDDDDDDDDDGVRSN
jgi:hypothetical protein